MMKKVLIMLSVMIASSVLHAADHPFLSRNFWKNATIQEVKAHLEEGLNVNQPTSDGLTPLSFAAMENQNPAIIELLIQTGAVIEPLEAPFGWTPLFLAAMSNPNPEVIEMLVKHGADVNQRCQGISSTPLIDAVVHNPNPDIAMTLLKNGANTKLRDEDGHSALDYVKLNPKLQNTELHQTLQNLAENMVAKHSH